MLEEALKRLLDSPKPGTSRGSIGARRFLCARPSSAALAPQVLGCFLWNCFESPLSRDHHDGELSYGEVYVQACTCAGSFDADPSLCKCVCMGFVRIAFLHACMNAYIRTYMQYMHIHSYTYMRNILTETHT